MKDVTVGALDALGWVLLLMKRKHTTGQLNKEIQGAIDDLLLDSGDLFRARTAFHV
jgi:hypothetical protein